MTMAWAWLELDSDVELAAASAQHVAMAVAMAFWPQILVPRAVTVSMRFCAGLTWVVLDWPPAACTFTAGAPRSTWKLPLKFRDSPGSKVIGPRTGVLGAGWSSTTVTLIKRTLPMFMTVPEKRTVTTCGPTVVVVLDVLDELSPLSAATA